MERQTAPPPMVPPALTPSGSPRPSDSAAFPPVGAVAAVVGVVWLVPAGWVPRVVEVVSCPRRYLPSSVPPQPAANSTPTAVTAAARFALDSVNPSPRTLRCGNAAAYASAMAGIPAWVVSDRDQAPLPLRCLVRRGPPPPRSRRRCGPRGRRHPDEPDDHDDPVRRRPGHAHGRRRGQGRLGAGPPRRRRRGAAAGLRHRQGD